MSEAIFVGLLVVLLAPLYFVAGVLPIRRQEKAPDSEPRGVGVAIAVVVCLALAIVMLVISVLNGLALGTLAGAAVFLGMAALGIGRWTQGAKRLR